MANTANGCYYLKVPILLMTATFNRELMTLLEEIISIKIPPHNHLCGNRNNMARQNIKTNVEFTTQRPHHSKGLSLMKCINLLYNLFYIYYYIYIGLCFIVYLL